MSLLLQLITLAMYDKLVYLYTAVPVLVKNLWQVVKVVVMQNKTTSRADCYTYVIYDSRLAIESEMLNVRVI